MLALLSSIIAARGLGTDGYGVYGLAVLIPGTAFALLSLGLAPGLVFVAGRGHNTKQQLFASAILTSLLLGLIATVFIGTAGLRWSDFLFQGVGPGLLLLALVATPIYFLFSGLVAVVQGLQDFRSYNVLQILVKVMLLILLFVTVSLAHWGPTGAVTSWAIAYLIGILAVPLLKIRGSEIEDAGEVSLSSTSRQALAYGLKAHVGNLMTFLSYRIDRYLLVALVGPTGLGLYLVAAGLAERLWMVSTSASNVLFPRIAALHGDEMARREITSTVARHVFTITLLMALALALLGRWIIGVFYGTSYSEALKALVLLLPGVTALALSRVLSNDLAGRGRPELNSYVAVLGLLANVGANLVLIPRIGFAGAAIASTISYTATATVKVWLYHQVTGVPPRELLLLSRSDMGRIGQIAIRTFSRFR